MNLPPDKSIQLRILSAPAYLPVVRAATERICELIGFDPDSRGGIILSLDEALTNIIRHAYQGADDQPIEIQLTPFARADSKGLRISLRDYGRVADPSEIKSRDLEDVRPGGLGVHIMNECMDKVEYHPAEGGGTLLTMVKTLGSKTKAKTNE
jgi:anti-sigma regulatory factor (Ser/Thr protein kinase)